MLPCFPVVCETFWTMMMMMMMMMAMPCVLAVDVASNHVESSNWSTFETVSNEE